MFLRNLVLSTVFIGAFSQPSLAFNQSDYQTLLLQKQYLNQINQCASPASFNRLVDSALFTAKPEQKAQIAMSIEEMILQNPACFVDAAIKLGKSRCEMLEAKFIQEPHFYPRDSLKQALSSARQYSQSCFAS